MAKKIGVKRIAENGKTRSLKPFEDNFHVLAFLRYLDRGREVGATLLKKHKSESYRVVAGLKCLGIPSIIDEKELFNIMSGLEALNDLPLREPMALHFGIFVDDLDRQSEIQQLMAKTSEPTLQLVLGGCGKRTRELTEAGSRKISFLNVYVSYTVETGTEQAEKLDLFDKILLEVEKAWYQAIGSYEEVKQLGIQEILKDAYQLGICRWERLMLNQLGLIVSPMTVEELWAAQWTRLNVSCPKRLPQVVTIEVEGGDFNFKEEVFSRIHPLSYLVHETVPVAGRSWVKAKERYTGVLVFADKPDDWANEVDQISYLWDVLGNQTVYDTEIFCQIQRGQSKFLKQKLQLLTKQAIGTASGAAEKNDVDVGASLAAQKAIEAQEAIYSDEEPFKSAIVALIHRPTRRMLNRACADFQSYFRRNSWIVREEEYAHRIFLETFPALNWDKLLTKPFERRQTYITSELPGLMPLMCNRTLDDRGFELIADEGGTPIHFNIYERQFHMGVFATSGSGKSVLMSDLLVQGLPRRIPITVLEFPRPDGTGSFDGLCEYLPQYCAYADIGSLAIGWNLLEPPPLGGLPHEVQQERFNDFKEYLLEILLIMVLGLKGKSSLQVNEDTVRSLLLLGLESFYDEPEIRDRFARAFVGGFSSLAWGQMPTLVDLLPFFSLERLQISTVSEEILYVLDFIRLRFRFWLESRLGQLLSKVTTFKADAQMLVVALRNLTNDTDAAIVSLLCYLGALRRSLANPVSIFFIDEAPILLEYDAIASLVGRLFANGRKSGIRVILCAQGIRSVTKCVAADKILDNMEVKLIGRVQMTSLEDYENELKIPYEIVQKMAGEGSGLNSIERYAKWLAVYLGRLIYCRHYPSAELFALVANNAEQSLERKEFFNSFEGDRVEALYALASRLAA